jgi:anti-sigma factor RsiW
MKCNEIRDLLPLHLYGDVNDAERAAVESHLATCDECRAELAALAAVRKGLDAPIPALRAVDVASIYQAESDRLRRRSRRWRAAAVLAAAAALLFLALRVEVRADGRQLVLRWGEPEPVAVAPPVVERVVVRSEPASTKELEERINRVSALIQALASNMDAKDIDQKELARLRREFAELQQIRKRLGQTERDVAALYTAQFGSRPSGVNP